VKYSGSIGSAYDEPLILASNTFF